MPVINKTKIFYNEIYTVESMGIALDSVCMGYLNWTIYWCAYFLIYEF